MIEDDSQTIDTQSDGQQILNCIMTYDFITLIEFWKRLLIPIDRVQKRLQDKTMNFYNAALDLKGLRNHFNNERERIVVEYLENGKMLCDKWGVKFERRPRGKKELADENVRDEGLSATDQMKRVMKGALNRLHKKMNDCFSQLFDIDVKFGFLHDVQRLCYSCHCGNLESLCDNLTSVYSDDLDGKQSYEEIIDSKMLISSGTNVRLSRPEDLLTFLVEYGDEIVFPNLRIALQILLASCEQFFSKLKLILSYLDPQSVRKGCVI